MRQLKIAAVVALAVILQSSLRNVWNGFVFIDLPLIVVVYFALRRDALEALIIGAAAGLAADAMSSGLLGAGGFSKTLVAFVIVSFATRVNLDNALARIPVLAGAALLDASVYVVLHRLLSQSLPPFADFAARKLIWTTIVGAIILFVFDTFFSERARQRRQLAGRRKIARRGVGSFGRRK